MNKIKREPVLVASSIAGVIIAFVAMLVNLDALNWTPEQVSSFNSFIVPAVGLTLPIIGGYFARRKVTPVVAPQNADGVELTPKGM